MTLAWPHPARRGASLLAAFALLAACGDSAGPVVPAQVTASGGNNQSVRVTESAPAPLQVRVLSEGGGPVQGEQVTWAVTSGGATVDPATSSTDANGVATTTVRMGQTAGDVVVTATVRNLAPATFTLKAVPGEATTVIAVSGNNQTGPVGRALAQNIVVEARDAAGNTVSGVTIEFSTSSGSISPAGVTDAQGRASATWTLGATPGQQSAQARIAGRSTGLTINATATAGPAASIEKVSGDEQQGAPGAALPAPLVVLVEDAAGNPVSGATVTFTTPNGGSFSPAQAQTGPQGMAQTVWTLGSDESVVNQTATATVAGVGSVTFNALSHDPCEGMGSYAIGQTLEGSLSTSDCRDSGSGRFYDTYGFELAQTTFADVAMTSSAFAPFMAFDPPGFGFIAQAAGTVDWELIAGPGSYIAQASSASGGSTGAYTISSTAKSAMDDGCNQTMLAGTLQLDLQLTPQDCGPPLTGMGQSDGFYTAFRTGAASMSMSSPTADPILILAELSGSQFTVVAVDTGTAGAQPASIEHQVAAANIFLLIATVPGGTTSAAYALSVTPPSSGALRAAPGEAAPLRLPEAVPAVRRDAASPFRLRLPEAGPHPRR